MIKIILPLLISIIFNGISYSQSSQIDSFTSINERASFKIKNNQSQKGNEVVQNEVHLISGEVLNCNVKSLNNGVLTVNFKGNNIHLKIGDVTSIFFTKSEPKIESLKPKIESLKPKDKGELKGIVTYFFNNNLGSKPDIGADVYINRLDNGGDDFLYKHEYDTINTQENSEYGRAVDKCMTGGLYTFQYKYFIQNDPKYHSEELDNNASENLSKIKHDYKNTVKTTVDGNGNYSVKLETGLYEIVFISKGRKGKSKTEHEGRVHVTWVNIIPNETKTESYDFGMEY